MRNLVSRLKDELLNAPLDLSGSVISQEESSVFRVTARISRFRIFLGLLFGLPGLFLFKNALASLPSPTIWDIVSVLLLCPVLAMLSILFGFTVAEKTFRPSLQEASNSIRFLRFTHKEITPLPKEGIVKLTTDLKMGDETREFLITVEPMNGFGFVVMDHYSPAQDFGKRLAGFLRYEFSDLVPAQYRSGSTSWANTTQGSVQSGPCVRDSKPPAPRQPPVSR